MPSPYRYMLVFFLLDRIDIAPPPTIVDRLRYSTKIHYIFFRALIVINRNIIINHGRLIH